MFSIVMRVSVQRSRTLCCIYRKFPFRILKHQPDLFVSNNGKFRWRYCCLLSLVTIIVTFKPSYSGGGNRKIDYLSLLPCPFTCINILLYQFACLFLVGKCFLRPKYRSIRSHFLVAHSHHGPIVVAIDDDLFSCEFYACWLSFLASLSPQTHTTQLKLICWSYRFRLLAYLTWRQWRSFGQLNLRLM